MNASQKSALVVAALFAATIIVLLAIVSAIDAPTAPEPPRVSSDKIQATSRYMTFDDCLKSIRLMSGELGVAPINIVETDVLRMVRYMTVDGSVLVTCSRPDQTMVVTVSKD